MSVYLTRYAVLVILEETEFTDFSENGEKTDGRTFPWRGGDACKN